MKIFNIEFEGIISGDLECFCFDVPADDFRKITGLEPRDYDESKFNPGLYRIYPSDIVSMSDQDKIPHRFKIRIEAKEVEHE